MNRTWPVDLQTHTTFSDGTDTPEELVAKAAALGIRVLAVTDHDSVRGVAAARAAGAEAGVHVLPAIELSTAREEKRDFLDINILGYGIDPDDPTLLAKLEEVIESPDRAEDLPNQTPSEPWRTRAGGGSAGSGFGKRRGSGSWAHR